MSPTGCIFMLLYAFFNI